MNNSTKDSQELIEGLGKAGGGLLPHHVNTPIFDVLISFIIKADF
jgi:hypothetical protein